MTKYAEKIPIHYFSIVNIVDNILIGKIFQKNKVFSAKRKYLIYFILFSIFTVAVHLGLFFYFKRQNLFEILKIPRLASDEEMKIRFQEITQEFSSKMRQTSRVDFQTEQDYQLQKAIFEMIKHPLRRKLYDKYLELHENFNAGYLSIDYSITKILYSCSSSMIPMIITIGVTDKGELIKSIKWVIIALILGLLLEIDMILGENNKPNIIDTIFPYLTIQERCDILKCLIHPIMVIIKNYFSIFVLNDQNIVASSITQQTDILLQQYASINSAIVQIEEEDQRKELSQKYQKTLQYLQEKLEKQLDNNMKYAEGHESFIDKMFQFQWKNYKKAYEFGKQKFESSEYIELSEIQQLQQNMHKIMNSSAEAQNTLKNQKGGTNILGTIMLFLVFYSFAKDLNLLDFVGL